MVKNLARTAVVAAAAALLTAGCGGSSSARQSDPPGAERIQAPDDVARTIWTWCDHGNRLYSTNKDTDGALAVAAQDPTCPKDGPR